MNVEILNRNNSTISTTTNLSSSCFNSNSSALKEISVLVFIQIDLIQIEYSNRFTYKLMWYDLYHVSNFTQNCMYQPYM